MTDSTRGDAAKQAAGAGSDRRPSGARRSGGGKGNRTTPAGDRTRRTGPEQNRPPDGPAIDADATLASLGEWGALEALLARLPATDHVLGAGDDAAALAVPDGEVAVISTDTLVEGVHFESRWSSPDDLGYRAVMVAASDLAAMAARPLGIVMAISAPGALRVGELLGLGDGMVEAATASRLALVGGDTTGAPLLVLTATVLGSAGDEGLARRDTVHSGDRVLVTGQLGEARAGLEVLQAIHGPGGERPAAGAAAPRRATAGDAAAGDEAAPQAVDHTWLAPISPLVDLPARWRGGDWQRLVEMMSDAGTFDSSESVPPALDPNVASRLQASLMRAVRRLLRPRAQLEAGVLARRLGATAMIDVSDGLASELHHLAAASGVGFRITADWVPVGRGARAWGYLTGRDPLEFALGGGDDYELLFTAPPQWVSMIAEEMQEHGIRVSEIGEAVDAADGLVLVGPEGDVPLRRRGYQHFGRATRRHGRAHTDPGLSRRAIPTPSGSRSRPGR